MRTNTFLLGIWLVFVAVMIMRGYLTAERERLKKLTKFYKDFQDSSERLLKSDFILPTSIVDNIKYWNEVVADKKLSRLTASFLLIKYGNLKRHRTKGQDDATSDLINDNVVSFFSDHPEMLKPYYFALLGGILTSSYRGRFIGLIVDRAASNYLAVLTGDANKSKLNAVERATTSVKERVHPPGYGHMAPI